MVKLRIGNQILKIFRKKMKIEEEAPICHANFTYEKCDRIQMFGCTFCDLNPNKEEWFSKEHKEGEQLRMNFEHRKD